MVSLPEEYNVAGNLLGLGEDIHLEIIHEMESIRDVQMFLAVSKITKNLIHHYKFSWATHSALKSLTGTKAFVFDNPKKVEILLRPNIPKDFVDLAPFEVDILPEKSNRYSQKNVIRELCILQQSVRINSLHSTSGLAALYIDGYGTLQKQFIQPSSSLSDEAKIALKKWFEQLSMPSPSIKFKSISSTGCLVAAVAESGTLFVRGLDMYGAPHYDGNSFRVISMFQSKNGNIESSLGPSPILSATALYDRCIVILQNGAVFVLGKLIDYKWPSRFIPDYGIAELTDETIFVPKFIPQLCGDLALRRRKKKKVEKKVEGSQNDDSSLKVKPSAFQEWEMERERRDREEALELEKANGTHLDNDATHVGEDDFYGLFGTHKPVQYVRSMDCFLSSEGIVLMFVKKSAAVSEFGGALRYIDEVYCTPISPAMFFKGERVVAMEHHLGDVYMTNMGTLYLTRGFRKMPGVVSDLRSPLQTMKIGFDVASVKSLILPTRGRIALLNDDGRVWSCKYGWGEGDEEAWEEEYESDKDDSFLMFSDLSSDSSEDDSNFSESLTDEDDIDELHYSKEKRLKQFKKRLSHKEIMKMKEIVMKEKRIDDVTEWLRRISESFSTPSGMICKSFGQSGPYFYFIME
ncbi:uncharacterized protein MONOS_14110 [Monocercomonoides exilis]|uniref:uncharacterized protein n=1 Tax=Monocercomonoides exilis TaxID=2049356 RepID=UPI00355A7BFD|nr:hypothetical protein MONOS_14110 [Monocercomonoides exilis]|eukprot:MONOS_14110.1-p1 / transcript=MONOS_14110.1 / gene=MONOS_14110 / organism=Monocercomonoides_exilis_PA203 / gene_product=unspecified product / transcript_product=unspecified product / location=Mono_scaffold00940:6393-8393(-) / protein_length=634 / sequence_SO=supercontig / SO=protein_coding / is_pseudo=false